MKYYLLLISIISYIVGVICLSIVLLCPTLTLIIWYGLICSVAAHVTLIASLFINEN